MVAILPSYELPGFESECNRQPLEVVDREIPEAALDTTDVGAIDGTEIGERVLTKPSLCTRSPQIGSEDLPESAWMGTFHVRIERGCRRYGDGL